MSLRESSNCLHQNLAGNGVVETTWLKLVPEIDRKGERKNIKLE